MRYEALTAAVETVAADDMTEVRSKLADIVRANPNGLYGSAVKSMLRRALTSTFDESAYGFGSFSQFLGRMADIVRVDPAPAAGGDLRVYPAATTPSPPADSIPDDVAALIRQARLNKLRYERNAGPRRDAIARLHALMTSSPEPFSLLGLHESMRERDAADAMTVAELMKYARILYLGRAFEPLPDQEDLPLRERRMELARDVGSPEDLVLRYETLVAVRLLRGASGHVEARHLAAVLGLDDSRAEDLSYCEGLLARARPVAETLAADGARETAAAG